MRGGDLHAGAFVDAAAEVTGRRIFARTSWVFNADQVDGYERPPPPQHPNIAKRVEHADAYLSRLNVPNTIQNGSQMMSVPTY